MKTLILIKLLLLIFLINKGNVNIISINLIPYMIYHIPPGYVNIFYALKKFCINISIKEKNVCLMNSLKRSCQHPQNKQYDTSKIKLVRKKKKKKKKKKS